MRDLRRKEREIGIRLGLGFRVLVGITWRARRVDWRWPGEGLGIRDEGMSAFLKLLASNIFFLLEVGFGSVSGVLMQRRGDEKK